MTGPAPVSAPTGGGSPLDGLLREASLVLVVGPGGVGKTTLSAALAASAADRHGRRVLVVTVDPARRLAQALGVEQMPAEPVLVPLGPSKAGRLWAQMIDMSRSWDALVRRISPTVATAEALLANGLYRSLTREFVQSHDYIALDLICDLADDDRYDLVVIDTPPSTHALDVLDAPSRMVEFFDSRLARWLIAPSGSRLAQAAARPFLALAERLLGAGFLARIAEFFGLFTQLRPGLVARARDVERRLGDPTTAYVLVTTGEPAAMEASGLLVDELAARGRAPALVLHNRALPAGLDADPDGVDRHVTADPSLARAVRVVVARAGDLQPLLAGRPLLADRVHPVAWRHATVASVADLRSLLDGQSGRPAEPAPEAGGSSAPGPAG